jgi:hypothetical protein
MNLTNRTDIAQLIIKRRERKAFRSDCRIDGVLGIDAALFEPIIFEGMSEPCWNDHLIQFIPLNPIYSNLTVHILLHHNGSLGRECSAFISNANEKLHKIHIETIHEATECIPEEMKDSSDFETK